MPRPIELQYTPDLIEVGGRARDAGLEVSLIERPMPDATSVLAVGRQVDIISVSGGVRAENAAGELVDEEAADDHPLLAAQRLWTRLATQLGPPGRLPGTGPVAVGGFSFTDDHELVAPWQGFPALRWRVPQLAISRSRGRSFLWGDANLLELEPGAKAPAVSHLQHHPDPLPVLWQTSVQLAIDQLRAGRAEKVMLARQLRLKANGVLDASRIARSLRSAYPACFTYLISGDDGSALVGASPELLLRRHDRQVTAQPMAGSIARGRDEVEDQLLAEQLRSNGKNWGEHAITARRVVQVLQPFSQQLERLEPEIIRFTNLQ
ncbi:MAG: chorismate-binding protein, partial [Candidatus Dormibacteraceae bacterium]